MLGMSERLPSSSNNVSEPIKISVTCTISLAHSLYMFRFLPETDDGFRESVRREGYGNCFEHTGEIEEDDRGLGSETD